MAAQEEQQFGLKPLDVDHGGLSSDQTLLRVLNPSLQYR
jgi:hypothetical protein